MRTTHLRLFSAVLLLVSATLHSLAQTEVSVNFPFKDGTASELTFSDSDSFESGSVSWGDELGNMTPTSYFDNTFTRLSVLTSKTTTLKQSQSVTFTVKPVDGLYFTPTHLNFRALRFGTDGGYLTVKGKSGEKKEVLLGEGQPNRNNANYDTYSSYSFPISKVDPSFSEFSVTMYITNLDASKSIGFSDVEIVGNVSSEYIPLDPTRPEVAKKKIDFVVPTDGTFKQAVAAANSRSDKTKRYHIFVQDGSYFLGDTIGVELNAPNVSITGQSMDNTIIHNDPDDEGISITATVHLKGNSKNIYMQDLTLKSDMLLGGGRGVALCDRGDKNIFRRVRLSGYQDTYYTPNNGMRCYWEEGEIHGTVDFICGGGDVFFNNCLIYLENRDGNVITAHTSAAGGYGYVFNECTIEGADKSKGTYRLGRNWGAEARAIYINTTMNIIPAADGWAEMNKENLPKWFGEYNSRTSSGAAVDCSKRKTTFLGQKVSYNPVLTAEQAARFTLENVIGGSDDWTPRQATEQLLAPYVSASSNVISWADNKYALCWGVFRNGKLVEFVTVNSYALSPDDLDSVYTVRAVNEFGGLSESSNGVKNVATSLSVQQGNANVVSVNYYSTDGKPVEVSSKGVVIKKTVYDDGSTDVIRIINR